MRLYSVFSMNSQFVTDIENLAALLAFCAYYPDVDICSWDDTILMWLCVTTLLLCTAASAAASAVGPHSQFGLAEFL